MSNPPQTEQHLTNFVANYLHNLGLYGAACRVRCHGACPLTPPESWELSREIVARGIGQDATALADYLVRLVAMGGWAEIDAGMRALRSTKSSRAACDAILAHEEMAP